MMPIIQSQRKVLYTFGYAHVYIASLQCLLYIFIVVEMIEQEATDIDDDLIDVCRGSIELSINFQCKHLIYSNSIKYLIQLSTAATVINYTDTN